MAKEIDFYKDLQPVFNCVDYTVSNESYSLLKNTEYDMLVTQPVPDNLESYYQSETYISHTNSQKSVLDKIYQIVRKLTLQKKCSLINSFGTSSKKLLDVGSGTGDFLSVCQKDSWEVVGVEPNKKARAISLKNDVNVYCDLHSVKEDNFDVITLWHVLEHVKDLTSYIETLKSKLSPNGILLIAVPNYKSYDATYYKEHWAAYDVPRHLWHFSQKSIQTLCSHFSMHLEKTIPMKFDSFYVSLLSEKYKKGKHRYFKAFCIGFLSNLKARTSTEYSSLIYLLKKQ